MPDPSVQILVLDTAIDDVRAHLRQRSVLRDDETEAIVSGILRDVRERGDQALLESARRFDAPNLADLIADEEELRAGAKSLNTTFAAHLDQAAARIRAYHEAQHGYLFGTWSSEGAVVRWKVQEGAHSHLGQRAVPVSRAGVYVPGGAATYPSSVLMNVIPAEVAGVPEIVVCTPAQPDGTLHPSVAYALTQSGRRVRAVKVGGAAAVAAMALGTESVPRVDKLVGPGNRFVNEAKRQLWGQVGLDGYAGPSEVCVVLDDAAEPRFAAADLLTQVEHAPDNAGFLVSTSRKQLDRVLGAVAKQLEGAPRAQTMRAALRANSLAVVARDLEEALDLVNEIAPEHLTLAVQDPEAALSRVQNAGCVLLGEFTPESGGDYCIGPSHTLPTAGAARWQSPVNVLDFVKLQSVSRLTSDDLQPLIPTIEALGSMEGFPAHAFGATVRRTL